MEIEELETPPSSILDDPAGFREKLEEMGEDLHDGSVAACVKHDHNLNLNALAIGFGLENIKYEPEVYPGLLYIDPGGFEVTAQVFADGHITVIDAVDEESATDAILFIIDRIESLDLVPGELPEESEITTVEIAD